MAGSDITWRLVPRATPIVRRWCSRCEARRPFHSSDKFRINASGRRLDVWLIYKCENCKMTWNSTILSRVTPESIDKELYQKFLDNDTDTAHRYAFDFEVLKKNDAEFEPAVEYDVEGPDIDEARTGEVRLEIDPGYLTS